MREEIMGTKGRHNIKKPKLSTGKKQEGNKPEEKKSTK
jgi:hypothetical protein